MGLSLKLYSVDVARVYTKSTLMIQCIIIYMTLFLSLIFTHLPHHLLVASPASHDNVADYTTQIASIVRANWNASSPGVARICSICEARFGTSPLFTSEGKSNVMRPQRFAHQFLKWCQLVKMWQCSSPSESREKSVGSKLNEYIT